jgi:predicted LPLAT superfamily acyltransferase
MRKAWSSRSIGSRWQHGFFYSLIRLGGRRAAYAMLVFVVLYYVLFRPSARNRSRPYLERRFPGRNAVSRLWDSYRISLEAGKVLVDRAVLGILGPGRFDVDHTGREELLGLAREGHGLILVTAHAGCWQVAMANLDNLRAPINLLIHREEGDVDLHYFEHGGAAAPYRIIDPAAPLGGTLEMLHVLNHGEVLCIMGDRAMGSDRGTVAVDFLGGAVQLPFTPYKLASATGAPVAVIFLHKSGPDSYALQVAKVIRVPENLGRTPEAYRPYANQFVLALEDFVAAHPYQYFNFFDMWH